MMTAAVAGYLAEQHVFNELMRRGVAVYKPLVHWGPNGMARLDNGQIIELEILSVGGAGGRDKSWFQIVDFQPRPDLFIICIAFEEDAVAECWIFPSAVFHTYATGQNSIHRIRDFKLDGGIVKFGAPVRELLSWFHDRWELITDFERYRGLGEVENVTAAQKALREQSIAQRKATRRAAQQSTAAGQPAAGQPKPAAAAAPPPPESDPVSDIPSWEEFADDFAELVRR